MMLGAGGFCWDGAALLSGSRGTSRPCGAVGTPWTRASVCSGNWDSTTLRDLLVPTGDSGVDGDE